MRHSRLIGTDLAPSVLGFGCAPILGRIGRRDSLCALETAFDEGVTYFDVARSYGYGDAEHLLGRFLAGRREKVVLATKFGVIPTDRARVVNYLKPFVRQAISIFPDLRAAVRRQGPSFISRGHFSVEQARASLETSLRNLRTDYVDILFLHDCRLQDLRSEALFDFLDGCVKSGKVRYYGLASRVEDINEILAAFERDIRVVQFANGVLSPGKRLLESPRPVGVVGHSPFGGVGTVERIRTFYENSTATLDAWSKTLGLDLSDPDVVHRLMLGYAVEAAEGGVVVCSMFRQDHIRANARLADDVPFSAEQLEVFARLVQDSPMAAGAG